MLYHIYSGHLFFSSCAVLTLVAFVELAGVPNRSKVAASISRVVALSAIALTGLSGTPVDLRLAVVVLPLSVGFILFGIGSPRPRPALAVAVIISVLVVSGFEIPFHVGAPEVERPRRVIVIGDSLSSGGFGENEAWPSLVSTAAKCEVVNLARPGDTSAAAVEGQMPDVPDSRRGDLVIIEIGGNDMLDGHATSTFAENLEQLLGAVADKDREVIMFELPLLPGRWSYGSAQRRLARRHGVTLIPKRILAGVLLDPDNTYDGLHMTQRGHDELARFIVEWAGW